MRVWAFLVIGCVMGYFGAGWLNQWMPANTERKALSSALYQQKIDSLQQSQALDQQVIADLKQQLSQHLEQKLTLQQKLNFYERLLSDQWGQQLWDIAGLQLVQQLSLQQYQLLVYFVNVDNDKRRQPKTVSVVVRITGSVATNEEQVIELEPVQLELDRVARAVIALDLPSDFSPDRIQVEATLDKERRQRFYSWADLVKK